MEEKAKSSLKMHRAKLAQLFQRIQRTFDLCKNLSDKKTAQHFISLSRMIPSTVTEYVQVEYSINEIELSLDPEYKPVFNDAYVDLVAIIERNAENLNKLNVASVTTPSASSVIPKVVNESVLPRIELPTFSGKPSEWAVFYELFKSLVHDSSSLSEQHKIQYLVSKLTGEAANICKHLPPIATNYKIIWDALVSRYNDPRAQINAYFDEIFQFKSLKVESRTGLANILDRYCNSITALKRLHGDELTDLIFLYQGLKILDPTSRREFETAYREKDIPTYKDFVHFIERQLKSLPANSGKVEEFHSGKSVKSSLNSKSFSVQSVETVNEKSNCLKCHQGSHNLTDCRSFFKLSPFERFRFVKDKSYCIKCLLKKHSARECNSKLNCSQCGKLHHSLLHFEFNKQSSTTASKDVGVDKSIVSCCSMKVNDQHKHNETTVLLSTVTATVYNRGKKCSVRFLLDTGSQHHFLTTHACRRLGLSTNRISATVTGFGGGHSTIRGETTFQFFSNTEPDVSFVIQAWVVDHIIDKLPSNKVDISKLASLKNLKLADEQFYLPSRIDGIIGAELIPELLKGGQSNEELGSVKLVNSVFGCILMGRAPISDTSHNNENENNCLFVCNPSLNSLVQRFWEVEECPKSRTYLTKNEIDCENQFKTSVRRLDSGRFVVSLPFLKSSDELGDSFSMARRRLLNLEKRLACSDNVQIAYHEIMLDYLRQGHMSLVKDQEDRQGYYIPHHAIVKTRSTSTPLRIVFDASAKTVTGLCLNDVLHIGPKLQTDIFSLLLHFRLFSIALTADIKQMYRQIVVDESCRRYQRILWRFSSNDPIEIYELNCVVFGITSSPYLALRTIHQLVQEEGENFPIAEKRIPDDMFMDDLVTSVPSLEEANDLYSQSKELFRNGGFELTKWTSNSKEMLSKFLDSEKSSLGKDFEAGNTLAILGLEWQPGADVFCFHVNLEQKDTTKRNILSTVARIFDPLGLLAPVTLFLKCLIKRLWKLSLDWDEIAPIEIQTLWKNCQVEFNLLSKLSIPRYVGLSSDSLVHLIGFCDASELGYGAVIYLKVQNSTPSTPISLLCSKSKVAPSKTVTIPRLELCAALLLSELMNTTLSLIRKRCQVVRVLAFSDSTVALHWIRASPSRWQTFVANRVSRIQDCPIDRWFHVAGAENPADCLSRGLTPSELIDHKLWWAGPSWLSLDEEEWPVKIDIEPLENPPEEKRSENVLIVTQLNNASNNVIYELIERCSNYCRLLRIMVIVLKTIKIIPRSNESEIETAELYLCKVVQRVHFSSEITLLEKGKVCPDRFQRLSPFLDKEIVRVGGRLKNANMDFDNTHPIILPKNCHFVYLLIDHCHTSNCHAGPHLSLSLIRQKFWILSARTVIRSRIRKCNICFRCRPINLTPKMGDLPSYRVSQCKPFEKCGVDYAGPINITMARRRNPFILKSYICLFVCMATKAIHIELASDLSTQQFLAVFRRFLSRRGPCRTIYSDCGTNFVGANEQLIQLSQLLSSKEFRDTLSSQFSDYRIDWKFIPPGSPNFGGLWESNIKSVKSHLFRVIGKQLLTYEELNSVLVQIEAVLNSRPLCQLSADPSELQALTPAHFLTLTPLKYLPMSDVEDRPINRLSRFELINQMTQSFWSRWRKEYLHELQIRSKWYKDSTPLTVGTVVIVDQPNLAPLRWPLGIIDEVFHGSDGIVRVATVRLASGRLKRPVSKLYPLPTQ